MQTHSAVGGAPDESFIQRQGSHLGIGGGSLKHTQEFQFVTTGDFTIASGQSAALSPITFSIPAQLGARVNAASIWQTYRVKSLTYDFIFEQATASGGSPDTSHVLAVVPYNRNPFDAAGHFQGILPLNLPECQSKVFTHNAGATPDQVQMLKVTTNNPMYNIHAIATGGTVGGETYSNGALSLNGRAGPDNTTWYAFIAQCQLFRPHTGAGITITHNVLGKVEIEFEGLRWTTGLYPTTTKVVPNCISPRPAIERCYTVTEEIASEVPPSESLGPRREEQETTLPCVSGIQEEPEKSKDRPSFAKYLLGKTAGAKGKQLGSSKRKLHEVSPEQGAAGDRGRKQAKQSILDSDSEG